MSAYPAIDDTAHCRRPGVDPERFHPPKSINGDYVRTTKAMCNGGGKIPACPFRDACREWGITHAVSGIWGGFAEDERKAARKARRIVPEPLLFSSSLPISVAPRQDGNVHGTWGGIARHARAGESPCDVCREFRNAHKRAKKAAKKAALGIDDFGLRACDRCGKKMLPKSVARHVRNVHPAAEKLAS